MAITEKKLIVITGASRSGTTLLSFILRNNSQVFGLNELHYFGDIWNPEYPFPKVPVSKLRAAAAEIFSRQQYGVVAKRIIGPEARAQAQLVVDSLAAEDQTYPGVFMAAIGKITTDAGKFIPCLQTPRNIFYTETLLKIFPHAHFVHMLRDPRAVMASQKHRWQRRSLAADKSDIPLLEMLRVRVNYHPFTVSEMWLRASKEARHLVDHERFTLVRFEDLLNETETTLLYLCDRLGLNFERAMLDVRHINSSHQSSVGGALPGFNKKAINSWRNNLSPAELTITERRCDALMRHYGYVPEATQAFARSTKLLYIGSYLLHVIGVIVVNPRRAWIQARALLIGVMPKSTK